MDLGEIIRKLGSSITNKGTASYKVVDSHWNYISKKFHNYLGDYYQLATDVNDSSGGVTCNEFFNALSACMNKKFEGYKGGEFTMHTGTNLYLTISDMDHDGILVRKVSIDHESQCVMLKGKY